MLRAFVVRGSFFVRGRGVVSFRSSVLAGAFGVGEVLRRVARGLEARGARAARFVVRASGGVGRGSCWGWESGSPCFPLSSLSASFPG